MKLTGDVNYFVDELLSLYLLLSLKFLLLPSLI